MCVYIRARTWQGLDADTVGAVYVGVITFHLNPASKYRTHEDV
jgi:hypothetical protein